MTPLPPTEEEDFMHYKNLGATDSDREFLANLSDKVTSAGRNSLKFILGTGSIVLPQRRAVGLASAVGYNLWRAD